jgi:hypothetical protein
MLRAAERAPKVLPPRIARNIDEELRTFVKNWDVTQGIHGSLFPRLVNHHLTVAREVLSLPDTEGADAEQIAIAALNRMGASPAWRDADARAIVRDLREAGLLRTPPEGVASLRASGTPDQAGQVTP